MLRVIASCCVVLAACGDNGPSPSPTLTNVDTNTAEDTPLTFTIPLTATKAGAVTLTIVTPPSHGALSGSGPTWTYTPTANFNGEDTIVVRAEDVHGSATASVTIHVTAVDDAPVAHADSLAAIFGSPLTIAASTLLANDTDIDNTALTVSAVTAGTHGTVALSGTSVVFTPEVGFNGTATFEYTASDGAMTSHATVTVTIGPDTAPVAVDDAMSTNEDVLLTIASSALVGNDTDAENQTLTIVSVNSGVNGVVALSGNQVLFNPDANYHGPASFNYVISDGYLTDTGTVTVTVTSINDVPVAVADTATTTEDVPLTLLPADLLANDTDGDNDPLTLTAVTATANTNGSVVLDVPFSGLLCVGSPCGPIIIYTPTANFAGTADFTYTVSDGQGGTATGTVTVTVTAVDDSPVAVNDSATVTEDDTATAITVLNNDTDVDAGPISIASTSQPIHGTVVITGGGTGLTYAPNLNYCNQSTPPALTRLANALSRALGGASGGANIPSGPDTFTYTLSPGGSTATVSVTVTCADDAPVARDDTAMVPEDSASNTIDVLANDTDIDSGVKTVASVTSPGHGTASVAVDELSVLYTPAADYCNQAPNAPPDTFTYTLAPGTSTATVSVSVTCACGKLKSTDFVVAGSSN